MQQAVIFDMDGVLVDSYRAHKESWINTFRELGIQYSEADFATDFGRTNHDILIKWMEETKLSDERIRQIGGRKEALYRDIVRNDFPAMDGAAELIESLHSAGFAMAIGSSGPPENVQLALERLPGGELISSSVTGADVTRGKPDPQVFLLAAEKLGIPPRRCAVVEDAIAGIEAANHAGMTSIALTGTTTREQLAAADLIVDSLADLSAEHICEITRKSASS